MSKAQPWSHSRHADRKPWTLLQGSEGHWFRFEKDHLILGEEREHGKGKAGVRERRQSKGGPQQCRTELSEGKELSDMLVTRRPHPFQVKSMAWSSDCHFPLPLLGETPQSSTSPLWASVSSSTKQPDWLGSLRFLIASVAFKEKKAMGTGE